MNKFLVKSGFAFAGVFYTTENASELSKFSLDELEPYIKAGCLEVISEKEADKPAPKTPSTKR